MDYLLQIKIKNGPLMRLMKLKGIDNGHQLAREAGIAITTMGKILNLTLSGINKFGHWRKPVITLADFFNVTPEDIFPAQHIEKPLLKNTIEGEVSLDEMLRLTEITSTQSPELDMLAEEKSGDLDELLETISSRERKVLRDRYGFGDKIYTLRQLGDKYGVGASRIRQIELKALSRLKRRTIIDGRKITDY